MRVLRNGNQNNAEPRLTRGQKLRRTALGVGAAAMLVTGVVEAKDVIQDATSHSIDYLKDMPQEHGVVVESGDTPNSLVNRFNEGGLSGQARQDALDFVKRQGAMQDSEGNPVLRAGQTVDIPELPPEE